MVSSCSSSASTASAYPANMSLTLGMAMRDEDKKHKNKASKKKAQEVGVQGAFKCKLCPRSFNSALARGGHQKAHRHLHTPLEKKKNKKKNNNNKKKAIKGPRPVCVWSPSGLWPCSYATAFRSFCLRARPFEDWSSHYDLSPPSFPWQTDSSTGSLAVAPAAGGTGDGGHLLRLRDVGEVSQEEPVVDGIDLTLKL